jgi:hypothetical protein
MTTQLEYSLTSPAAQSCTCARRYNVLIQRRALCRTIPNLPVLDCDLPYCIIYQPSGGQAYKEDHRRNQCHSWIPTSPFLPLWLLLRHEECRGAKLLSGLTLLGLVPVFGEHVPLVDLRAYTMLFYKHIIKIDSGRRRGPCYASSRLGVATASANLILYLMLGPKFHGN